MVLYVTSLPAAQDIPALQNLTRIQRAVDQHIRVDLDGVVAGLFAHPLGRNRHNLAIQTGGQVVQLPREEPLPSPEMYWQACVMPTA